MKWIKASERLPEDKRNASGQPLQIFVEFNSFDETNLIRTAYTTNQIADFSKSPFYKELRWLDESQQSLPDALNKFIEDEKSKLLDSFILPAAKSGVEIGFDKCAQLLLPQLQECKEMNDLLQKMNSNLHEAMVTAEQRGIAKATEEFQNAYRAEVEQQKSQIEAQQEEIKQLKAKLELVVDWQYIMALERNINEQAAEIESLKRENECYSELLSDIDKSLYLGGDLNDKEILDWYIEVTKTIKESISETLKQQTHG